MEHRANLDAEALGLHRQITIETSPANVLGIEINPYAAELARVTIWIGEIQWMLGHGYDIRRKPILSPLDQVQCRDALLNEDGTEAEWPKADAIIGNPPFLGNKKMLRELGTRYVATLRDCLRGRVPRGVDLVAYWFDNARVQIAGHKGASAGLVATQGIRGGVNRRVLAAITANMQIFEAWSDEPWVNEGAAVRVSLICFSDDGRDARLNGHPVASINSNLTAGRVDDLHLDVTLARVLTENAGTAFQGIKFVGAFAVSPSTAREWLKMPANPNGTRNESALIRWVNGMDLTRRPADRWLIDFGPNLDEPLAALFEAPYACLAATQRAGRAGNREQRAARRWWLHQRPRPEMRSALAGRSRYIATPEVAKHRIFVFLPTTILPSGSVYAIARDDDCTFGVLHSRFHEVWSLATCTWMGKGNDPRYTPSTTFDTFPFPDGFAPRSTASEAPASLYAGPIAEATKLLVEQRDAWLNPPEWTDRVPEVVAGYPDRVIAKSGHETDLRKRTLTNLYNARPAWLDNAHKALDAAVAEAYGWTDYTPTMPDEEILRRLLALNQERSAIAVAASAPAVEVK